jgi:aspartate/methionine/tyrosine aminotransferase
VISTKLRPFGVTIFTEMTHLAQEHGAINLSQGFPDFDGPAGIIDAAVAAMRAGENQYARSRGPPLLVRAIAASRRRHYGLEYDPETEVTVCSGATEAIASSLLGLLEPGDEVILIEPFYDSYPACLALAGAVPRYLTLRFPDFAVDLDALRRLVTRRTRLLVLNTPHNPTGKVFTRTELEGIAAVCQEHDLRVLADEVYEHLTYDDAVHLPLASLPGMRDRTLTLSSTGKTFSLTGWKIGWAVGPRDMIDATQAAHQFVTFATATPLQVAMAYALEHYTDAYLTDLRSEYGARRAVLVDALRAAGFEVAVPRGTYFVVADFRRIFDGEDREFVRWLIAAHGVAAIPPSVFYAAAPDEGRHLVRFAFCKQLETLRAAAARLQGLRPRAE